ncbi:hypothetical protein GCM10009617_04460 [Leifsonia poae]|uniref:Uncharacterized protein n=1 Tax=Leifsonia poae TaxID=110933 RepID=A0A9W6H7U2_9MICO|nr:hypothetical protein GCM10017584_04460 [Leifsonia poae]
MGKPGVPAGRGGVGGGVRAGTGEGWPGSAARGAMVALVAGGRGSGLTPAPGARRPTPDAQA